MQYGTCEDKLSFPRVAHRIFYLTHLGFVLLLYFNLSVNFGESPGVLLFIIFDISVIVEVFFF